MPLPVVIASLPPAPVRWSGRSPALSARPPQRSASAGGDVNLRCRRGRCCWPLPPLIVSPAVPPRTRSSPSPVVMVSLPPEARVGAPDPVDVGRVAVEAPVDEAVVAEHDVPGVPWPPSVGVVIVSPPGRRGRRRRVAGGDGVVAAERGSTVMTTEADRPWSATSRRGRCHGRRAAAVCRRTSARRRRCRGRNRERRGHGRRTRCRRRTRCDLVVALAAEDHQRSVEPVALTVSSSGRWREPCSRRGGPCNGDEHEPGHGRGEHHGLPPGDATATPLTVAVTTSPASRAVSSHRAGGRARWLDRVSRTVTATGAQPGRPHAAVEEADRLAGRVAGSDPARPGCRRCVTPVTTSAGRRSSPP